MARAETVESSYREVRRGIATPFPWVYATWIFSINLLAIFALVGIPYNIYIWIPTFGGLPASGILILSTFYTRTVKFANDRYTEQARMGSFILWREEYDSISIMQFTVGSVSTWKGGSAYHVVLNLKSGESRLGMAHWKREAADSICSELNRLLQCDLRRTNDKTLLP